MSHDRSRQQPTPTAYQFPQISLISSQQSPTITASFPRLGADMALTRAIKGNSEGANVAKLTKRVVDAAKADSAATFIWDDEIKGFGLRIAPGGTKSYILTRARPQGAAAPHHDRQARRVDARAGQARGAATARHDLGG
jgi:hypothetical protein